uniref:CbiN domain protein-like protein n=1 Tax=Philodina roseola TaxID=96448 RepID=B3G4N5_PHIRO|nr:cbiN domain protein-like protein [Philodina roseola]
MLHKRILPIFILCLFCISSLTACSCMQDISLEQRFSMATQIFIGTAVDVTVDDHQMIRRVIFHVEENFKGKISPTGFISIVTDTMESACGLTIEKNEKWQIWADKSYEFPNQLEASYCSASTKNIQQNLTFLRKQFSLAK